MNEIQIIVGLTLIINGTMYIQLIVMQCPIINITHASALYMAAIRYTLLPDFVECKATKYANISGEAYKGLADP